MRALRRRAARQACYGRPLAETHLDACMRAGLPLCGMHPEAVPGVWEFELGAAGGGAPVSQSARQPVGRSANQPVFQSAC